MDKNAMYKIPYGLYVLTAREGEKDNGCIINTAAQVTSSPNRITVAVNKDNYTHDMIKNTGVFNVSVLTEGATFETFENFGFQSGREADKLAKITFSRAENGVVYLTDKVNAVISGKVCQEIDMGTHTIFVADVTDAKVLSEDESVTYGYYQKNIKPSPEKKSKGYVCVICGYIYEGDELPADFVCPICKHGVSDFKKL